MGVEELFDLTGRVAVVTGGSRGIGRGMALGLAGAGATVVVASRKLEACEAVASEIRETCSAPALPVAFHAGRWEDADALCERVYDEFGRCDVLVNNAAIAPPYVDPIAITQELWDKTMAVNIRAPFRLSMLFGTRMKAAGGGSIINVSGPSKEPKPDGLVYGISKGALDTLTLAIGATFGPTVRANSVYPGMTDTDMLGAWDGKQAAIAAMGIDRLALPADFMGTVIYLASDASKRMTRGTMSIR